MGSGAGRSGPMSLTWHGGRVVRAMPHVARPSRGNGRKLSTDLRLVVDLGWGVDRFLPWTRTHIRPSHRAAAGRAPDDGWPPLTAASWTAWPPGTWTGSLTGPGRAGPGTAAAGGPPGRPMAQGTRRRRCPRRGRGRARPAGRVDRGLAAQPAPAERPGGQPACPDRPSPVPRPADRNRPGRVRRGDLGRPRPGARPRHPRPSPTTSPPTPNRSWSRRPGGWTQPGCGGSSGHLLQVADPDGADRDRERRHARRGLWLAPTFEGMVAVDGLLEPEAGQTLLAALEPLARPADAHDTRSGSQRNADALTELARRAPGGRAAPPDRWGPAPAERDRGPGQPPRPPRGGGWRGRLGRPAGPRGVPAAGL